MACYDYLIVGAGLFGCVFAREAADKGKRCLVIDRRGHIGGNIYTEKVENINVHRYGAHIFHTGSERVWAYVNRFAELRPYEHHVLANYRGKLYHLPFNMTTFREMWGVETAEEARAIIDRQRGALAGREPQNLEEQAVSLVGEDVYRVLVKGYTEKQWGRACTELPPSIIRRLPVRYEYNNNYFNDPYQAMPADGYTALAERLLEGVEVRTGTEYRDFMASAGDVFGKTVYTGAIDEFFGYRLGKLEYRTVRFETEVLDRERFQASAVVNYTDRETPFTRIIEHKQFEGSDSPKTVISREYSKAWEEGDEPYYPVNDGKNAALFARYKALATERPDVIFGGRLGEYRYYDMDKVILSALELCDREL